MPLYHRTGISTPTYDRRAGRHVNKDAFNTKANWVMDLNGKTITQINNVICRGGAERSSDFYKYNTLFSISLCKIFMHKVLEFLVLFASATINTSFYECRFVLEVFTKPGDVVIDLLAGTGCMGREARMGKRHCVCVENDQHIFDTFLLGLDNVVE